ncbi:hypothetical protein KGR20_23215 [Cytobacillus oceanisediminis]|uniref:hypothetical protein n=1 Tax=Bacillaceae TaxID=186817 RepID=UPI001CCB249D|nr:MULTISPECIES: hypothetical protein [Bacillaceae]MBZ9537073.1 hypothetical protein [Cytobacillus oceanisediminis]UTI43504.1 hypothetical protein NKG37_07460 [Niallia sp. RD1]
MQKNAVNKVGYMVHLSSERDDSIDLDLKQQVLSTLLENVRGLEVAEYLSYKSNPSVAQYFISLLRKQNIDTIAVQDRSIFKKDIINLFIEEGFHFILIDVNSSKTKYRIEEISNDEMRSNRHNVARSGKSKWKLLSSGYRKALIHNEKAAKMSNDLINHFESTNGINVSAY